VLAAQRKDHSERCKFNYNLEIARSYLNDTFYLPHNMDFRGRAYPIPPHLSPVGDDLCRGLLTFGVKKPIGKTGLKWLQIHLANVYGFDKASFEERARFAQDHEQDIFDSADKPLEVSTDSCRATFWVRTNGAMTDESFAGEPMVAPGGRPMAVSRDLL
jgi:DNA-directed RNA polymerase